MLRYGNMSSPAIFLSRKSHGPHRRTMSYIHISSELVMMTFPTIPGTMSSKRATLPPVSRLSTRRKRALFQTFWDFVEKPRDVYQSRFQDGSFARKAFWKILAQ